MTFRIHQPCVIDGCRARHGVIAVRANHKPAVAAPAAVNPMPAHPQPVARALRAGGTYSAETPRDGRESSLSDSPLGRSRSRSSQAASQVASRSGGAS